MIGNGIVLESRTAAHLATLQLAASHRNVQVYGLGIVVEGRVERIVLPDNAAAGGFDPGSLWRTLDGLRAEGVGDRHLAVVRAAPTATTKLTQADLAVAQMLAPAGCPRLFVLHGALRPTLAVTTMATGRLMAFAAPLPVVADGMSPPTAADRSAWRRDAMRALRVPEVGRQSLVDRDPAALFDHVDPAELREFFATA